VKSKGFFKTLIQNFSIPFAYKREGFRALSTNPVNDIDISCYEVELERAFGDNNNKTIAFWGEAGTGKSSVIETYKKAHSGTRFLQISHIHRNGGTAAIEGDIINQLIRNIDPKKIPATRFPVRKQQNKYVALTPLLLFIALFVCILHIYKFNNWKLFANGINAPWLLWAMSFIRFSASHEAPIFSGLLGLTILTILLYIIIRDLHYRSTVQKVNLKGTEIELYQEEKAPYFDHFENDVIYLFENAEADIIVFENIDSCFSEEIFLRLNKINLYLNNNGKALRFIYLMTDDCWAQNDMNKLFDFSFSVTGFNVYDRFKGLLHKSGIESVMPIANNEDFFKRVANEYNIRELVEICNNFTARAKNRKNYDCQKLMAMAIFETRFRDEYLRLINGTGFIHYLITKKETLVPLYIESKIRSLQKEIEDANAEHLQSKEELDIVYSHKISETLEQADIDRLRDEETSRLQAIEGKLNISEYKKEIRTLQRQKKKYVPTGSLREILFDENADEIISSVIEMTEISKQCYPHIPLLIYFIKGGYIDESFNDYLRIGSSYPKIKFSGEDNDE